jgi:hypothetical protein
MGRRLLDHEEEETSSDIPQQLFAQNNNNNSDPGNRINGAVVLELEEQRNNAVRTGPISAAMFQVRPEILSISGVIQYDLTPIPVDGGNMFIRNGGIYLQVHAS